MERVAAGLVLSLAVLGGVASLPMGGAGLEAEATPLMAGLRMEACCADPELLPVVGRTVDDRSLGERLFGGPSGSAFVVAVPEGRGVDAEDLAWDGTGLAFLDPGGRPVVVRNLVSPEGIRAFGARVAASPAWDGATGRAYDFVLVVDVTASGPRAVADGGWWLDRVGDRPVRFASAEYAYGFDVRVVHDVPWASAFDAPAVDRGKLE